MNHDAACCANLQEEAASVSQQREQLVLAEKLFGMDITGYPDLVQVCCSSLGANLYPVQVASLLCTKVSSISCVVQALLEPAICSRLHGNLPALLGSSQYRVIHVMRDMQASKRRL